MGKTMYTLQFYDNGTVVDSIATTDIRLARGEYHRQLERNGIAPRLFVDGARQTICQAEKLLAMPRRPEVGRSGKPKYVNRHGLMPKRKCP